MSPHLQYSYDAELNPYDIDMFMEGSLAGINQLSDKAAFNHIRELGFATEKMLDEGLAWLLYQKDFNILKPLRLNETYRIETRITGKRRLFTYRDFSIYDSTGDICIEIASSWVLFNLKNRSIVKVYPDDILAIIEPGNEIDHLPQRPSPSLKNEEYGILGTHKVVFNDLDTNGHMSNHALLCRLTDALPHELMHEYRIVNFRINYRLESFVGDTLRFEAKPDFWRKPDEPVIIHATREKQTIAIAELSFDKRDPGQQK